MRLESILELGGGHLAELGRPVGAFRSIDGRHAVVSEFDRLYWVARATYEGHRLRHRVSLYAPDRRRLAVCDAPRWPVNEVAFHPSLPLLAIGTGSYDGGYAFEGELLLWDYARDEVRVVLSERREVTRLRFVDEARLALLLRPADEGELEDASHDTFFGGVLDDLRPYAALGLSERAADPRIAGFAPVAPEALGFGASVLAPEPLRAAFDAFVVGQAYEERHRVWDVAWNGDDELLAVHDGCHLEAYDRDGGRRLVLRGPGHGVQLFAGRGPALVHVVDQTTSTLFRLEGGALRELACFNLGAHMSVDRAGRVLVRDAHMRRDAPGRDCVLDGEGRVLLRASLGHYDCFNHPLRIDGGEALYFLRGTPPSSHEHKQLCALGADGAVRVVSAWDDEARHLLDGQACLLDARTLARAYRVHDYSPERASFCIEARGLDERRPRWRRPLAALVTAMVPLAEGRALLYALTSGELGLLDARSGEPLWTEPLRTGGTANVALSLAARGDRVASGTLDGRILVFGLAGRP